MSRLFRAYRDEDFDSCVSLVKETWQLHEGFENIPDETIVYEHYFKTCLNWNEHLEVLVEDDVVKGVLFGSIENESYKRGLYFKKQDKSLKKWTNKQLKLGRFGCEEKARARLKMFEKNDQLGEQYAHKFDSEINLFIVSSDLRGQGFGIQLMDHYVEFCRRKKLKTAFLWTDRGCSYTFYDKYGFQLYKKFDSSGQEQHGMIYYLTVDGIN